MTSIEKQTSQECNPLESFSEAKKDKHHGKQSSCDTKNASETRVRALKDKTKVIMNSQDKQKLDKAAAKQEFSLLSEEDKTIRVRGKLEKIVHSTEKDTLKTVDLLRVIERIKLDKKLLSSTKIDLTVEAVKYMVKDDDVQRIASRILSSFRKIKNKIEKVPFNLNDEDNTTKENAKTQERSSRTASDNSPRDENVEDKNITVIDELPSIRIGYWMDKLMENSKALDSLNQQVDDISKTVHERNTIKHKEKGNKSEIAKQKKQNKNNTETEKIKINDIIKYIDKCIEDKTIIGKQKQSLIVKLRELWALPFNKDSFQKTCIEDTLKCLKTVCCDKEILKEVKKVEEQFVIGKAIKSMDDELDEISTHIQKLKIQETTKPEVKKSNVFVDDIDSVASNLKSMTIVDEQVDNEDVDIVSDKLFSKPEQIKRREKIIPKEKVKSTETGNSTNSSSKVTTFVNVETKLLELKKKIDEFSLEEESEEYLKNILEILEKLKVTPTILQSTKIGLSINKMRKLPALQGKDVSKNAKRILINWKKLSNCIQIEDSESGTEHKGDKQTQSKDDYIVEVRESCRNQLLTSLKQNDTIPEHCHVNKDSLTKDLEAAIFDMFGEITHKYKNQIKSRVFNIKNNVTLQENILLGNLPPAKVAVMTHEEMANDEMKKLREKLKKEEEDELLMPDSHVQDDMFCTCRICLPPWIQK